MKIDKLFYTLSTQLSLSNKIDGVQVTQTDLQYYDDGNIIWFGTISASLTLSFMKKNVIINIVPTSLTIGNFKSKPEINISLLNHTFSKKLDLDCDEGELFQMSTMYDFDFLIIKNIMTKYLELLKVLPDRKFKINIDDIVLQSALTNVSKAVKSYGSDNNN